jgi:DnaJ-class molecular chaperone
MSHIVGNRLLVNLNFTKWSPKIATIRSFTSSADATRRKDAKFYAVCFRTLELDPDSSQDLVRRQYIRLVKKYHPDSAKSESERDHNLTDFHKVDEVSKYLTRLV